VLLLGRAAIFSHKEDYGFQDCPRSGRPSGEGWDGCEEPTSQLHAGVYGKGIKEIRDLHWRRVNRCRHQLFGRGGFGYALFGAGLCGRNLFRGCRYFSRRFLTPGLLVGAFHWGLLRGCSDLCRNGFGRESGLGLGNTTLSEHVVPPISEAQPTVGAELAPSELLWRVRFHLYDWNYSSLKKPIHVSLK
jgi:hypothetical protein